jgi:phosphoglycerate dehydrogenase-like enzyme
MTKIAILNDYANAALTLADWAGIKAKAEVRVFDRHLSDTEIVTELASFEVICTLRERARLTAEILAQLPALKAIVVTDAHVRTIDYRAAEARGIKILEARAPADLAAAPSSTSEFVWGLILATLRHIPQEVGHLRDGHWQGSLGQPLAGKTIGLVGLGKIGSKIAQYARTFDMSVIAWSQNLTAEAAERAGARRVDKAELFREADLVSVHYVLSERSRGLVGAAELGLMKPSAYFFNTSRGPIVDERALITTLENRRIAGAGLDVFDQEPLPDGHPFTRLDNVVATPHLGFATEPNMRRFYVGTTAAVEAYLSGENLPILSAAQLPH